VSEPITPDDPVSEAIDESFPASDPPEWTGTHAGAPVPPEVQQADDLKTVSSAFAVDEAVARIERSVTAAGMKVFARSIKPPRLAPWGSRFARRSCSSSATRRAARRSWSRARQW
jgi:hypothetical protein